MLTGQPYSANKSDVCESADQATVATVVWQVTNFAEHQQFIQDYISGLRLDLGAEADIEVLSLSFSDDGGTRVHTEVLLGMPAVDFNITQADAQVLQWLSEPGGLSGLRSWPEMMGYGPMFLNPRIEVYLPPDWTMPGITIAIIVLCSVGACCCLLVVIGVICCRRRRRGERQDSEKDRCCSCCCLPLAALLSLRGDDEEDEVTIRVSGKSQQDGTDPILAKPDAESSLPSTCDSVSEWKSIDAAKEAFAALDEQQTDDNTPGPTSSDPIKPVSLPGTASRFGKSNGKAKSAPARNDSAMLVHNGGRLKRDDSALPHIVEGGSAAQAPLVSADTEPDIDGKHDVEVMQTVFLDNGNVVMDGGDEPSSLLPQNLINRPGWTPDFQTDSDSDMEDADFGAASALKGNDDGENTAEALPTAKDTLDMYRAMRR